MPLNNRPFTHKIPIPGTEEYLPVWLESIQELKDQSELSRLYLLAYSSVEEYVKELLVRRQGNIREIRYAIEVRRSTVYKDAVAFVVAFKDLTPL